ncbi:MAG: hypothetical protein IJ302_04075 [Clostridia bacterium]|nr:hypothetical protein [Clostridia bacterium]
MNQPKELSSRYCERLGMSVILCREETPAQENNVPYRCLSAHLCGEGTCTERPEQPAQSAGVI